MNNSFENLISLLKTNETYVAENGELLKAKIYEEAMAMGEGLLTLLLSDDDISSYFFTDIKGTLVFDKHKFAWLINSEEFLPDSYTAYINKIGLATGGKLLAKARKVVLDFPYKDAVLAGGQDRDDQKRDEVMFHEILGKDEVANLLAPKIFTDAKRYSANESEDPEGKITQGPIKATEEVALTFEKHDNLIIKGNNLFALSSLLERYEGRVKLIYIDPPFNTREDSFRYNDRFSHSTWLTFMRNRLEIAKRLLSSDGSIYIHLDTNEVHYLKVLMDEIFGRDNFLNEIIWAYRERETSKRFYNKKHDTILFYAKDASSAYVFNYDEIREEYSDKSIKKFKYTDESGRKYRLRTKDGKSDPATEDDNTYRQYLDTASGPLPRDWFTMPFLNQVSNERVGFNTQKPESLVSKFIKASTNENDIVLDFFLGSGTTAVAAHKLNRRYIGIEQMDYVNTVSVPRLIKTIEGKQGVTLLADGRQGGGSFVYCELKEDGQTLVEQILKADEGSIEKIKEKIYHEERIVPYLTTEELRSCDQSFESLELEDKKHALITLVNKNKLYVNYSSIDDEDFCISQEDKAFTKSFYEGVQ